MGPGTKETCQDSGVDFRSQAADELAGSAAVCRLSATSTSSKEQMPETTLQAICSLCRTNKILHNQHPKIQMSHHYTVVTVVM
jgi:hypothetical protein